jgi:hypothetical protein
MRNFFQAGRLFERVKNALFPERMEFRAKIFTVLAVAGFLISVSTAFIGLANDAGAGNVIANGIAALLAAALLAYSKRSGRYRLCYIITITGVFIGLFPFMFFSAGGYHSGMPGFFIFAVIFTIFMLALVYLRRQNNLLILYYLYIFLCKVLAPFLMSWETTFPTSNFQKDLLIPYNEKGFKTPARNTDRRLRHAYRVDRGFCQK